MHMFSHCNEEWITYTYCSFISSLDAIMKALRANGNVLLPVDTAGRVLELILILDQASWCRV